jgi:hypothetical protein
MQNLQTAVQDATDADRAMAQKRLKTWVPDVNPDDHSHIDAYLLAKMQSARQRVSLQAVLHILKQQELSVERSAAQEAVFYVVPRANFPKGLSLEQQKWMVTREEVAQRYEMRNDDTDYDSVYLFMDACPRAGLGKWIHQLRFSLKMSRNRRISANAAIENNNTAAASPAASANDGQKPRQRAVFTASTKQTFTHCTFARTRWHQR